MSVLNKLVLRHFSKSRRRMIVTVIGVILSAAMITAVVTLAASFQSYMVDSIIMSDGDWHVRFNDVAADNAKYVKDNARIEKSYFSKNLGFFEAEPEGTEPIIYLTAMDTQAMENIPMKLINGRMPRSENEIVVTEDYADSVGKKGVLDWAITLYGGTLTDAEGTELTSNSMGSDSDIFTPDGEKNDYKVVGLIEDPSFYPPYAKGSAAVTLLDTAALSGSDTLRVWATMKTPKDSFKFAEEMKESLYPGGSYTDESVEIHNELLMYMGVSDKDNINTILYTVVGILSLIIMAGSVSLIYNAFTISIGERSREYGMLSSVGSTPRQIRNSVFFEALVISAIGIPLGILAGVFGVGVTIQLIKPLMNDLFVGEMEFGLVVSPYGIIIAAALAVVTIFISAYIPARRAGKMTAIEAIRQAKDIKLKAKKVKTSGIIRRIFGFEGELATKQLKRSRRRYRTTIISLCISIILFMTVTSFTGVLQRSSEIYYSEVNFDIQCQLPLKHEQSQEFINDVLSLDGIEDYSIGRYIDSGISLAPDKLTGKAKEVMGNYIDNNGDYLAFFRLVSLSPQGFEKYLDELGLDAADYMDVQNPKGILINTVQAFSSDQQKYVDYEFLSVGAGEPFDLNMEIDVSDADTEDRLSQRVTVGALTDKLPLGLTHAADYIGGVNLVVSDEVMDELREKLSPDAEFGTVAVCLTSEDSKTLAGEIDRLRDNYSIPDIMVTDIESILQAQQNLVLLISVFTYGFIALITLIGITNVFNTISTNISLRRKEFAMLKSVGMTPGGFSRMICLESIFYGVRALLFGLPLGLGFGYLVYMAVTSAMDFPYSFPLYNLLICVAAVFLIVFSTMAYSFAKVKKENIIDALRQDT